MVWSHESFCFVVVVSLVSESSPHLFSASPIPRPTPTWANTPPSAWGRRPGKTRQYQNPFLSKKILEAGAVEYHRTFWPASDHVFPLGTFPESPSGSLRHISWKVAGSYHGGTQMESFAHLPPSPRSGPRIQPWTGVSSAYRCLGPAWAAGHSTGHLRGTWKWDVKGRVLPWHWTVPLSSSPCTCVCGVWFGCNDVGSGARHHVELQPWALKRQGSRTPWPQEALIVRESLTDPHKLGWQVLWQDVRRAWWYEAAARAAVLWVTPCAGWEI